MKYVIIIIIFLTAIIMLNCGDIKIKGDIGKDTIDHVADAFGDTDTSDQETDDPDDVMETDELGEAGEIYTGTADVADRYFVGTFNKQYYYKHCNNFPSVLRLYTHNGYVYIENNKGGLISKAKIFEDYSFDFLAEYYNELGIPDDELACTCTLEESDFYNDDLQCQCDFDSGDTCGLRYEKI